jgi:hypothetical protein
MKKLYFTPKIIRLIASHLGLGCARTSITKCNEPMPRGWNRQVVDIVEKKTWECTFSHLNSAQQQKMWCLGQPQKLQIRTCMYTLMKKDI